MTPEENEAFLRGLAGQAANAATPVANGLADVFRNRVVNIELKEEFHPPGMFWRQVVNHPPAYASGALARSVLPSYAKPTGTGYAESSVGAYAKYAAIQEMGGETWGNHGYMHWVNSGGPWWMKHVYVPQHPYFRPALQAVIRDGSLSRSAVSSFMAKMSPYVR